MFNLHACQQTLHSCTDIVLKIIIGKFETNLSNFETMWPILQINYVTT